MFVKFVDNSGAKYIVQACKFGLITARYNWDNK